MQLPYQMMINHLKANLNSLHWRTALLESCDWQEGDMLTLVNEVITFLDSLASSSNKVSPISIDELKARLLFIARIDQIDILVSLLHAEMLLGLSGSRELTDGCLEISKEQAEA